MMLRARTSCGICALGFCVIIMFASASAAESSGVDVADVDLSPPAKARTIDKVVIKLPAIDAAGSLSMGEEQKGDEKVFTFTNNSEKDIVLWTTSMAKDAAGVISIGFDEMAVLKPHRTKRVTMDYGEDNTVAAFGRYRLFVAACFEKEWGDVATKTRTAEGKQVDDAIKAFEKKIKDFVNSKRK